MSNYHKLVVQQWYQNQWTLWDSKQKSGERIKKGALQSPFVDMPTGKFLRVRKVFARIYKINHEIKPKQ